MILSIPEIKYESGLVLISSNILKTKVAPASKCKNYIEGEDLYDELQLTSAEASHNFIVDLYNKGISQHDYLSISSVTSQLVDMSSHHFYWKEQCSSADEVSKCINARASQHREEKRTEADVEDDGSQSDRWFLYTGLLLYLLKIRIDSPLLIIISTYYILVMHYKAAHTC